MQSAPWFDNTNQSKCIFVYGIWKRVLVKHLLKEQRVMKCILLSKYWPTWSTKTPFFWSYLTLVIVSTRHSNHVNWNAIHLQSTWNLFKIYTLLKTTHKWTWTLLQNISMKSNWIIKRILQVKIKFYPKLNAFEWLKID